MTARSEIESRTGVVFLKHVGKNACVKDSSCEYIGDTNCKKPRKQAKVIIRGNKKIGCISWRSSYRYLNEKGKEKKESNYKLSFTKKFHVGG